VIRQMFYDSDDGYDNSNFYTREGRCSRRMVVEIFKKSSGIACYVRPSNDKVPSMLPGELAECVMCLTDTCSDLTSRRITLKDMRTINSVIDDV
jgi:hypothetical protein